VIGSNVPAIGGFATAFSTAAAWRCDCIQIYLTPSRRWTVPEWTRADANAFLSLWQNSPVVEVVAHVPFLVNLASPDEDTWRKSVDRLALEIRAATMARVRYLVLHPGSLRGTPRPAGILRIREGLRRAIADGAPRGITVLLETMAGQGTTIGSRFEDLAELLDNASISSHCGICLDTAHVFEAGYDIRGYKGVMAVLSDADSVVGLNRVGVIHLNDSATQLGSGVDRHARIGAGRIGLQAFHAILRDSRLCNIPKILEEPDRDEDSESDLALLRRLATRRGAVPSRGISAEERLF